VIARSASGPAPRPISAQRAAPAIYPGLVYAAVSVYVALLAMCVPVGVATAKSMVANITIVHLVAMMGTVVFWGTNPRAPIGG